MRRSTTASCRTLTRSASPRPRLASLRRAVVLLGLALLMTASGAQAATLTVTSTEDAKTACKPGSCTLRAAIELANKDGTSDTIQIPAGEYKLTSAAGGKLAITASMTLAGTGARVTTIRAASNSQIFIVSAGEVALDDLTLTGAAVAQDGGAVQAEGEGKTSLTIERDIVTSNQVLGEHDGAGIHTQEGELVPVLIDSSTVSDNSAHGGGGVDGSGPFTVVNSTLTGNHVENAGAAMEVERTTLINDTISGNKCEGVEPEFKGEGCGGGVRFLEELPPPLVAISTAQDTIISGNTDMKEHVDNCLGRVTNLGPNLEGGEECKFSIQNANPMLGPLTENGGPTPTMLLNAGSPAIGAGTNLTCAKQDQRGGARPAPGGGQCDIGAVEVNSLADVAISGQGSAATVAFGGGIVYTLTATNLGPDPALSTTVENLLPAGATFVKATTAAGSCSGSTTLTCALGTLAPGASVAVNVSATLGLAGTATDVASAHAPATDISPADNQISILATVLAPVIVAPIVPSPVTPVLSHLAISPARFRVGSASTAVTAARRTPRGTKIDFTLSEPARVRIVLQEKLSGRRHGGRCLASSTHGHNQQGPRCTRLVVVGTLTRTAAMGASRVAFSGRVGSHPLKSGSYIATLTAGVMGAPASVPARAGFTIVSR
jgi:uncharacterized repeat protein (TIGR01451 family)/CSLREA domain-containing protein